MLLPFPLLPLLVNRTKESGVDGVGDGGDVMGVLNDEELLDDELSRLLLFPPPPPPLTLGDESGVAGRIGIGIEAGSVISSDGSRDGVETAPSGCCEEAAATAAIAAASAPVVVVLLL